MSLCPSSGLTLIRDSEKVQRKQLHVCLFQMLSVLKYLAGSSGNYWICKQVLVSHTELCYIVT